MATFQVQVTGLTGITISSSGTSPTEAQLTQFLTDGAKEVLNSLPRSRQEMFTTSNELNTSSTNLTLLGSEVFSVTRDDGTINQPCRKVPAKLNGRIRDSGDMMAATATDPAYYISNNILSVVPEPSNSNNAHVQTLAYPTVAYSDSVVAKFPDDGEYLIPLYASIKSLQNAIETIRALSNTQFDSAVTSNTAEDIELASSHLNAGGSYLNEIVSMEKQQAKLQADYEKGLAQLVR
tara:strand:- start:288 stop:995 length:708 start_codon:yes stop_codon:yes gene_type:complete